MICIIGVDDSPVPYRLNCTFSLIRSDQLNLLYEGVLEGKVHASILSLLATCQLKSHLFSV